jgi:cell division protein FtsI (penicillin-binding protein 3)
VRENAEQRRTPRPVRAGDPFRPALQVLDGGKPVAGRDQRRGEGGKPAPARDRRRGGDETAADPTTRRARTPARTTAARPVGGRAAAASRTRIPAPPAGRGDPTARTGAAARRTPAASTRRAGLAPPPLRRAAGRGAATGRPTASAGRKPQRPGRPPRAPHPPRLAEPRRRLRVATVLALALFAAIGIRLVVLQVGDTAAYADGGLEQRLRKVALAAPRGAIYDRSGAVLVRTVDGRYVYADPEEVQDPAAAAVKLSPLLGIKRSLLEQTMRKKKRPDGVASRFEYLARGVDVDVAEKIMALKLPGIGSHRDERRDVPGHDLAANLIGFTGTDLSGLEGLEARYDQLLRGVDGERIYEQGNPDTGVGKEIPGGHRRETPARPGTSLQLTIHRDLQFEIQRILTRSAKQVNATIAAAVLIDVRAGEVLAQASHPPYNAAKPFDAKPVDREDVATSVVVDPGSVHKALIFGAALNEGLINADSTMKIGPAIRKGDTTFTDTQPHKQGTRVTMPGLLAYSSNVGTIALADLLTPRKVYDYQLKFGLGKATGVGVPGEASGRVLKPEQWNASSHGSIPIGHSVDVTPLQMAAAYAAIANDGTWIQPHLIKESISPDGVRTAAPPPQRRQVISPKAAADLRTMLEAVTTVERGTGTVAAIPGYRVAGKTGTGARVVDGKYVAGEVSSFVGMAPADNPRYVVAVFAHAPGNNGGDAVSSAFRDMMGFTLRHYQVPPTGTKPPKFVITR